MRSQSKYIFEQQSISNLTKGSRVYQFQFNFTMDIQTSKNMQLSIQY